MHIIINIIEQAWRVLSDSAVYILFGLSLGGMVKVFMRPGFVAQHLGRGRYKSVFKAAALGIPLPLCSCGVMPAAASLKEQGANNGAVTSFLISTPESGVDSIALTYALMDPVMTIARPVSAMATAVAAGVTENTAKWRPTGRITPELSCPVDGCCDGIDCDPAVHAAHHTFTEKIIAGLRYAFGEIWGHLAGAFFLGIFLAGLIGALIPAEWMGRYLGGGIMSMLVMLAVGIPLYICATSSTPIAASLILKGVSPGAALVFLLAGPATNITSLTVLGKLLGKRATAIYLATIAVMALLCGLALDQVYAWLAIDPTAIMGRAGEIVPLWLKLTATAVLLGLSIKPLWHSLKTRLGLAAHDHDHGHKHGHAHESCGCGGQCNTEPHGCTCGQEPCVCGRGA